MILKNNRLIKMNLIIIIIVINMFVFLAHKKAGAMRLSRILRYYKICVQIGCPGGNKECAEYHPEAGTTVTCYQR